MGAVLMDGPLKTGAGRVYLGQSVICVGRSSTEHVF